MTVSWTDTLPQIIPKRRSSPYRDTCGRHYSYPDAEWGWDSDNKNWYFVHTLYMLCSRNDGLKTELPILLKVMDSKRWTQLLWPFPKNVCLNSAHDNIPTYRLLEHWDINALIDINGRAKSSAYALDDITFNKDRHPLCWVAMKCAPRGMTLSRMPINTAAP